MTKELQATGINKHIGRQIQRQRIKHGMTQQQVADEMGFQSGNQSKREHGINGCSAAELWIYSKMFGVSVDYFMEGRQDHERMPLPARSPTLAFAHFLANIDDSARHSAISKMTRAMAND